MTCKFLASDKRFVFTKCVSLAVQNIHRSEKIFEGMLKEKKQLHNIKTLLMLFKSKGFTDTSSLFKI